MSGSDVLSTTMRRLGRNGLDVPVAALAGLAVAYVAFAISPDQLSGLVSATGLPEILPAAEPPLGNKARIGLGAIGLILVFSLVFFLLRLLDRKPRAAKEEYSGAPRLRRRDHHPDAPARRPISATREFGEPASGLPNEDLPKEEPVPAWLSPAEYCGEDPLEEAELTDIGFDPEPSPEPVPETVGTTDQTDWEALDEAEPADFGTVPARAESIAELMARLEQGLARRQPVTESLIREAPVLPDAPVPAAGEMDDRLQSAIDSLQRFASRQG